ncbi:MAG: Hsp20/alpha crystallin family protein [Fusobacteriaceae bacterium]|jgi:HSP20 family molecular chaperone IbpA|nr:Hsp20/alpha crystallin family protein [Fusobacteriaceae bacterium]
MLPSILTENLFDYFIDDDFGKDFFRRSLPAYQKQDALMKTDIKETDTGYELAVDLPGYKKEEVSAKLENGYLTLSATKGSEKEEKDKSGRYIRRERYSGACIRSFYVGEGITQEDIKAKFENGVLAVSIPKKDQKKVEENKYIAIEG